MLETFAALAKMQPEQLLANVQYSVLSDFYTKAKNPQFFRKLENWDRAEATREYADRCRATLATAERMMRDLAKIQVRQHLPATKPQPTQS